MLVCRLLCFQVTPSPLLIPPIILPFILLVLLVLFFLFLLLGLVLLAEAYEVTLVVHGAGVMADRNDGWRSGDDESFRRDLPRLQALRRAVALCGTISEVPAVAVDSSANWG